VGRKERRAQEVLLRKAQREIPVFEFNYGAAVLFQGGPIIQTYVTTTDDHREALKAAGQPIPEPVYCRFLIDTGADGSVVKHEIAERAGLKLIADNVPLHGVGVDTTGRVYMGRIMFVYDIRRVAGVRMQFWVDTQVTSARLESDRLDGLIGRDVLQHFEFSYNGGTGQFRLRYIKPDLPPSPTPGAVGSRGGP
jgi:predicted aspartyl protease